MNWVDFPTQPCGSRHENMLILCEHFGRIEPLQRSAMVHALEAVISLRLLMCSPDSLIHDLPTLLAIFHVQKIRFKDDVGAVFRNTWHGPSDG